MAKQEKEKKNQKHFWKDFKAELKKVIWPTKKQLANNTMVVIAMVLVTTIIVLVLDLTFQALNTYGINNIKQAVQNATSSSTEQNNEEGTDSDTNNNEGETETNSNENSGEETETQPEGNNQETEQ